MTFINIKANSWQKLIAFESFTYIFNSKSLVKQLAESNEQCCLANILKIFEGYLTSVDEPINDEVYGHKNPNYQTQKLYKHLDDKNFDTIIPPPDTAVLIKLMIECMHNISNRFNDLLIDLTNTEFKMNIMNAQHTNSMINILTN